MNKREWRIFYRFSVPVIACASIGTVVDYFIRHPTPIAGMIGIMLGTLIGAALAVHG